LRKKIYIHVGYPKTGTTTLQAHFFPHIEEVQYLGKYVNSDKNFDFNVNIINDIIFKNKNDIDYIILEKEFNNLFTKDKILLSEEDFLFECLRPPMLKGVNNQPKPMEVAEKIKNIFDKIHYDVIIIMTIRKQDEMLTSLYAQAYTFNYSKYTKYNSFQKFLNIFLDKQEDDFVFALDYLRIVSEYQSIFGKNNIKILAYEELKKSPSIFYTKLCNILEIDALKYSNIAIMKKENQRSTNDGYKTIYKKNLLHYIGSFKRKYFPSLSIKINPFFKTILESITLSNSDIEKTIILRDEQKNKILNIYKESNQILSKNNNLNLNELHYYE